MYKKVLLRFSVLFLVFAIVLVSPVEARVGNATVTIYAGTNPADEPPQAKIYDLPDTNEITVRLPGKRDFYTLSRPSGSFPGWTAEQSDATTVTVESPDGLTYTFPEVNDYVLWKIEDADGNEVVVYDYNTVSERIDYQYDGFDPNLYIEYEYDVNGLLDTLYAHDYATVREYEITYDANDRAIAMTGSCESCGGGAGSKYEYDPNGRVKHVKNSEDTVIYEYAYDSLGRITDKYFGEAADSNIIRQIVYTELDDSNSIEDTYDYVDISNYRVTREYKNSGRTVKRIKYDNLNEDPDDPLGESFIDHTIYCFDSNGLVTKEITIPASAGITEPNLASITGIRKEYTYDPNTDELLEERWFDINDVNFTVAEYTYEYIMTDDGNDILDVRVSTSTDARQAVTEYIYDGNDTDPNLKLMPEVTSGISGPQQLKHYYEYDNRKRVVFEQQLDDSNNVISQTEYFYDNYSNLIERRDYDSTTDSNEITEYEYNGFNEMIEMTLPSGVMQGWSYNSNKKVEYEVVYYPDDCNYVYSQTKYSYYDDGRVKKIARADDDDIFLLGSPDNWVWTEYEYDLRGNKTKVIEDVNGLGLETTYEYNFQDEVTKVTLPNGKWTKTTRDGRGLVYKTETGYESTTVATTYYYYDENSNIEEEIDPYGIRTRYEYDDFDRVKKITRGL